MDRRPTWLLLLAISLALAGCATPAEEPGPGAERAEGAEDAAGGSVDAPDAEGETSAGSDAASEGERWHGFDFDQPVRTRSGDEGTLRSFTARMTEERDGELTAYDMAVEVGDSQTRDIRTKLVSFATGEERNVTTPLEVRELAHTITVVQDDTGERQAGDVLVFRGYEPVDPALQKGTFLLGYAAMEWTDENGEDGLMEYYVPEGQAAPESSMYLPYEEGQGDFSGHWGFSLFGMAYSPLWLAGWSEGSQELEEGSWSFAGHSYDVQRKALTVGGHTFDGWRVEWTASTGDASATYSFEVATTLPVPVAYHVGGAGGDSSEGWTWELRELRLR